MKAMLIMHIYTKFPFKDETTVFCAVLFKMISSDVRNLFLSEKFAIYNLNEREMQQKMKIMTVHFTQ